MLTPFPDEPGTPTEVIIQKNNLLKTVETLKKSFKASFELFIIKHSSEIRNALHLTIGGHYGKYGDRIPAVFLHKGGELAIRSAVSGQHDYQYDEKTPASEGRWYKIITEQVYTEGKVCDHQIFSIVNTL